MALSGKVESEVEIQAPAAKFYNFYKKQLEHLPNISTHIHGARVHEGDWESTVGSVKHWEYTIDGKKITDTVKIESIDDENMAITYVFDREMSKDYKNFKAIIQVIEKEHGGGIVKWTFEYEKIKEHINGVSHNSYLDVGIKVAKEIDAHLVKD